MSPLDPYAMTDNLDDDSLKAVAARLEERGKHPVFARMLHEYLDAMRIDAAGTVLDMGCGTGLVARTIARRAGFSGRVIGLDLSPSLAATAARLAGEEGIGERVEFREGDSRHLEFADGTFDAVVAHTLMSHVDDPVVVLREASRVLRPGGVIGIFDGDYASAAYGYADPVKGKAYDKALGVTLATSPRVMRQMPHLLRVAGLELVAAFPYVVAEIGKGDFFLSSIGSFRKLLPKAGIMTEEEAGAWADGLYRDSEEGTFFRANNYYSYVARRP